MGEPEFLLQEETIEAIRQNEDDAGDQFGHGAHVKTLEQVVTNAPGSWNIGLFGAWGAGKSTIVNILYERLRGHHWKTRDAHGDFSVPSSVGSTDNDSAAPESTTDNSHLEPHEEVACVSVDAWQFDDDRPRSDLVLDFNQVLLSEIAERFNDEMVAHYLTLKRSGTYPSSEYDSFSDAKEKNPLSSIDDRYSVAPDELSETGVMTEDQILETLYDTRPTERSESNSLTERLREMDNLLIIIFSVVVIAPVLVAVFSIPTSGEFTQFRGIATTALTILTALGAIYAVLSKTILKQAAQEFFNAGTDITKILKNPRHEWPGIYGVLYNDIVDETKQIWNELGEVDDSAATDGGEPTEADLDESASQSPQLGRIVITIDDLDRCESLTAYQLLIAIKSFLGNEDCLYIIPCDEDALYHHLEGVNPSEYLGNASNQQSFISKFFDTELDIPEPSPEQIEDYFDRKRTQIDFNIGDTARDVLLAADLKTPRRVIQSINRYVTLSRLAAERNAIDDYSPDSSEMIFLAKISILQEDYPNLYAELERDPDQLAQIWDEWGSAKSTGEMPNILTQLDVPEERQETLISFLSETRSYNVDRPAALFRLSSGEISDTEIFRSRVAKQQTEPIIEFYDDRLTTDPGIGELQEYFEIVTYRLRNGETRSEGIELVISLINAAEKRRAQDGGSDNWEAIRDKHAEILFDIIDETDMQFEFKDVGLQSLDAFIRSLDGSDSVEVYRRYVDAVIGPNGLRRTNFEALLKGVDDEFELPVAEALADELIHGVRQEYIDLETFYRTYNRIVKSQESYMIPKLTEYKQQL